MPNDERGAKRVLAAQKTIESWDEHLQYDGEIHLHIGDDGSHPALAEELLEFASLATDNFAGIHASRQERHGVGASLNAGQKYAFDEVVTPITLYAVDDWSLTAPLDLNPWVRVLREVTDVGAVRLGPPHPGIQGTVEHVGDNRWILDLAPCGGYVASQRPTLWHSRFFDTIGHWKEDCSSLECEADMNDRWYAAKGNPRIALALPHPWDHIYTVDVSDVDPSQ